MICKTIVIGAVIAGGIIVGVVREFGRWADDACAWMNDYAEDNRNVVGKE